MSLPIPEDLMYFNSELTRTANAAQAADSNPDGDLMSQMGVRISYARDEEIYAQEEDADLIYRVVRGAVRTSCLMSDGRRQIGDFYYRAGTGAPVLRRGALRLGDPGAEALNAARYGRGRYGKVDVGRGAPGTAARP